jgi:cytochrome b561
MTSTVHSSEALDSYGFVARVLHWIVFALFAAQMVVAWTMPHIHKGSPQEGLVDWHLSLGAALMFFVLVRIVWRIRHPVPPAPTLSKWERIASRIVHELLYIMLLVIPVLGWASASFFGFKIHLFGFIPIPAIADNTVQWAHTAGDIHKAVTTYGMLGLIGLHMLAALWHYFVRKDRVLQRMLPGV